jgi:DNA polymerase-4
LWGVGRVGQQKLHRKGIHKIADLRVRSLDEMKLAFGSWGEHLWRLSNGIDARAVVPDRTAKQIGHERTFHEDLTDPDMIRAVVSFLTEAVSRRLRLGGRQCRCVSIKYRRSDFRTFGRSITLPQVTDSTDQIFRAAMQLLETMRNQQPAPVRLIGVSLGSLTQRDAPSQLSLFDLNENESSQKRVDQVVDDLRSAIGDKAAYRATSHDWINRKQS